MDGGNDWAVLAGMMLATGLFSGVLAGLLGVGGGIVVVPVLEYALGVLGVDPAVRMHVAIATSLATIIPTSISSARAHHRKGAVDLQLVRFWGPFMFLGALGGGLLATHLAGGMLSAVFGVVALVVACKMLLPLDHLRLAPDVPRGIAGRGIPLAIGALSSMMGIGGGTLSVPVLTLLGRAIHTAVGSSALFGLLIALPGAAGYIAGGWGDARLPVASLGYVNLVGVVIIAPLTWLAAPWGVRLAHRLSKRQLGLAFGVFLLIVATRMLYRAVLS